MPILFPYSSNQKSLKISFLCSTQKRVERILMLNPENREQEPCEADQERKEQGMHSTGDTIPASTFRHPYGPLPSLPHHG
jgi:hypothetical protein